MQKSWAFHETSKIKWAAKYGRISPPIQPVYKTDVAVQEQVTAVIIQRLVDWSGVVEQHKHSKSHIGFDREGKISLSSNVSQNKQKKVFSILLS